MNGDLELLQAYADRASADAMAELVRRHLSNVYSSALRQLHNRSDLAEDVSQAVFILLAQKAPRLRRDVILHEWLFVTTRYTAKNALKLDARRRYHERRAAALRANETQPQHDDVSPLLDEAIAQLGESERRGVVLSYFANKTFREVGQVLGVSEDAARKRVRKAVEQMRRFFQSRGLDLSNAALSTVVATPVPPALVESVTAAALQSGSGTSGAIALAEFVRRSILLTKLKFAAGALAASMVLGVSGIALVTAQAHDKPVAPATQPTDSAAVAKFDDGVCAEVVGVGYADNHDKWWRADGVAIEPPCDPPQRIVAGQSHRVMLRATGIAADADVTWSAEGGAFNFERAMQNGQVIDGATLISCSFLAPRETLDAICRIANGPWETRVSNNTTRDAAGMGSPPLPALFAEPFEQDGKTVYVVSYAYDKGNVRFVAVDHAGHEQQGNYRVVLGAPGFWQATVAFDLPVDQIASVLLQVREFDHTVEFKNITLDPNHKTQPTVKKMQ